MKKIGSLLFGLLCTLSVFAGTNKQFDTVVIFGDSLSDTGNLYHYLWEKLPLSPPYYQGRFSNGPLWIEQVYDSYYSTQNAQGFQNYAVGGAGAVLSYKENLPITLGMEINDYLYWHTYGKKETTLYSIWIGSNNYLKGPTNVEEITDSVVNTIGDSVERLIRNGGNKFLLPNIPNLGLSPEVKQEKREAILEQLISLHNRKLAAKIDYLKNKYPDATFVSFDVYSYFQDSLNHAADLGFSNITDACYLGSYSGWLQALNPSDNQLKNFLQQQDGRFNEQYWQMINNNPQLKEAAKMGYLYQISPVKKNAEELNCEGYVFWDRIHPTTRTHYFLAQKARQLLDEAGLEALPSEE